ncbi:MAG: Re/Si-specific NAD(P)(+) transhydrogenase subunit alpha [Candidatus Omnitrophica bacterium]|nr:Re/Si-specific NAD(P)(+) transhydrogenase subunit alpha [Candidatus Omnitrophota bacterium]
MRIGVPKESFPGERRVAVIPDQLPALTKAGLEIWLEAGAGQAAGYPDPLYQEKGARIVPDRREVFASADVIVQINALGANPEKAAEDLRLMREGQVLIGLLDPLSEPKGIEEAAAAKITAFSLEMMPRITRAQSMDVLSSMATIAGYKAVILAAAELPKMFPMMMTAAGTIAPARVFVIGAGVAGLQAIATARRLGAVVQGYDVRPAVKEQVESLGAKFVELALETQGAEDAGGYAKAQGEDFYARQREMMARVVADNDVVITTALIPGQKAPVLITREMVQGMAPGSVIVDLAAERGGNCELTRPGEAVTEHGVTILGPLRLPSSIPFHASRMFSKNIVTFLLHLAKKGSLQIDLEDEITRETLMTRGGEILHPRLRQLLGLEMRDPITEGRPA